MSLTREQIAEGERILAEKVWDDVAFAFFEEHGPALLAAAKERDALAERVARLEKALRGLMSNADPKWYHGDDAKNSAWNEACREAASALLGAGASRTEASDGD